MSICFTHITIIITTHTCIYILYISRAHVLHTATLTFYTPSLPFFQSQSITDSSTVDAVIVPKKANWDLKRDLAPKKAKLERLTQRAIAEILRTRLSASSSAVSGSTTSATTTTTKVAAVDHGTGVGGGGGGGADLDAQVDSAVAVVLARSLAHSDDTLRESNDD